MTVSRHQVRSAAQPGMGLHGVRSVGLPADPEIEYTSSTAAAQHDHPGQPLGQTGTFPGCPPGCRLDSPGYLHCSGVVAPSRLHITFILVQPQTGGNALKRQQKYCCPRHPQQEKRLAEKTQFPPAPGADLADGVSRRHAPGLPSPAPSGRGVHRTQSAPGFR